MSISDIALSVANPVAGAAKIAGGLAMKHWKLIGGGLVVLFLVIALLLTRSTLAKTKDDLKKEHDHGIALGAALDTSNASLTGALQRIKDNNLRIKAASDELEREKGEVAASEAHNAKLAQGTDAEIAALRARASQPRKPCTLSDEAKRELGQ